MTTLQAWIVIGVPGLALAAGLFTGRSPARSAFGYLALTILFAFFLLVPRSAVSAASVGTIAFLLVAAGRGQGDVEAEPYGHEVPMRVDDPNVEEPRRV
ncbi:MAG: hypothetical protein M3N32_05220 [Actinomycetota bacterium]|nr:hypothetical protein [Actinomycetota bacterium]